MLRTLKILITFVAIFSLHRLTSWSPLSETYGGGPQTVWRAALTGFLSDLWVASLLSLPFWVFEYFRNPRARFVQKNLASLWVFIWGTMTAAHQAYVEFFKFQIIPFHLAYLTDKSFLTSNGSSMIATSTGCLFVAALAGGYWVRTPSKFRRKRNTSLTFAIVLLGSLGAHTTNIHWRVNWFVIEPLQANYLEALYSNFGKKPTVAALNPDELKKLTDLTATRSPLYVADAAARAPELNAFTQEIQRLRSRKMPVLIALVVAESLRDADLGPRETDGRSLTPALDRIASMGVRFTNLYSSGPVTRGGQESVWCGTPSATDTSLMRSFPNARVRCLPNLLKDRADIATSWIHGGDELFDSQLAFWRNQGVKSFITKGDFPDKAPRTGWGISDLALFDRASSHISDQFQARPDSSLLTMILSVTNHIPWVTPDDASLELKSRNFAHQQFKTISYFDESFDLFVGNLKQAGLWENSLLIVVGDHGNLEPTWRQPYGNDPMKWERMLSHVGAIITGGITERLRGRGELAAVVNEYASQTQIMPFAASLALVTEQEIFMDRPLFESSLWPVTSDLNQYLFLPKSGVRLPKEDVLAGRIAQDDAQSNIAALRYRSWLEFLYNRATH